MNKIFAYIRFLLYLCSVNPQTQQHIYRFDRTLGKVLNIVVYVMMGLFSLGLIALILKQCNLQPERLSAWHTLLLVYRFTWYLCGGVACICIVLRICLSPFVKSDEQEEFERKVEYILHQREATKPQHTPVPYSPLLNLTPEQEERVKIFLQKQPSNANKPEAINMAKIAQCLTALENMGMADLTDKNQLKSWVAQVTHREVPSTSQFNEALPSHARTKVAAMEKQLQKLIC